MVQTGDKAVDPSQCGLQPHRRAASSLQPVVPLPIQLGVDLFLGRSCYQAACWLETHRSAMHDFSVNVVECRL